MPLSDREQKILEEIESHLYEEDPKFARGVRKSPKMDEVRRVKLGAVLFLFGFALLIVFFLSRNVIVGVIAFGVMVGGIVLVAGALKDIAAGRKLAPGAQRERLSGLLQQWEERVRKRYKRR